MANITIGNRSVKVSQARKWVTAYTSGPEDPKSPFGYPAYDTYDTGNSTLLSDADLLAPVLLNVPLTIAGYESLRHMTGSINGKLKAIKLTSSILDESSTSVVGPLYEPLDNRPRPHGVRGTILSKVLHRKRPQLIPLYDSQVWACYSSPHDGQPARIPRKRNRSWAEYMGQLADAIHEDLVTANRQWDEIHSAVGGGHPITLLRCFDIVAWNAGKTG